MDAGIRFMLNVEKRFEDPNLTRDLVAVYHGHHMPEVEEQFENRRDEDLSPADKAESAKPASRLGLGIIRRIFQRTRAAQPCESC